MLLFTLETNLNYAATTHPTSTPSSLHMYTQLYSMGNELYKQHRYIGKQSKCYTAHTHAHKFRQRWAPRNELFYESTSILIVENKRPSTPIFSPTVLSTPKSHHREGEDGEGRSPWAPQVIQTVTDLQGFQFSTRGPHPWTLSKGRAT